MVTFLPGMEVSHFRLLERLGAGSSGDVFRAEDTFLKRQVALKILTRAETPEQKERFLREARLCSAFLHPHIAIVYEAGWHESIPFLAMELVHGQMLSKQIRNQAVAFPAAIRYAKQILEALHEAHALGIIHRDIKSSNIMITAKDQVKVLDFGLAKNILQPGSRITTPGTVVGTIEFLAPEQARGEEPDQRSDLFSAGVVLYHMLSGRLPFERETQIGTLTAILREEPDAIEIQGKISAILLRALAKDPEKRYQTAAGFLRDLDSLDFDETPVRQQKRSDTILIAVPYFEKGDADPETEYLRLGITEDIITDLSKVAGIKVLSRHAVQKYKDKQLDIALAVRDLQVTHLLIGKVQKSDRAIRVTAEFLNDAGDVIWNERYEKQMEDIFELQSDVSKSIVRALEIRLTDSEQQSLQQRSTDNLSAYEHFLKGRFHYNQYTAQDNRIAEEMFREAVRLDPDFAAAHVALSETFVQRFYNWFERDRIWLKKAEEVLARAYQLNDKLPDVHCTMGMLLYLRGEYEKAMEEVQKSIRLDPHYALAHDHSGEIYLHIGELDKAILAFHTEMRINSEVIYPYFYLVWIHSLLGDFSIAQTVLEQARRKHSRNPLIHVLEGTFSSYSGLLTEAEKQLGRSLSNNSNNSFAMGRLAVVQAQMGRWNEAFKLVERATGEVDPLDHHAAFDRACVMALSQNSEESLSWLRKAIELGWRCLYHYEKEPNLQNVRETTPFRQILDEVKGK